MKLLLEKEFKLTACPLSFVFLAFAGMTMIPGYPILMGVYFVSLGILYTFQFAREYNDTLFTALLPVAKSDVVKARFAFVVAMELIGFAVNLILTLVRMTALSDAYSYVTNPLMNANFVYLGAVLILYAVFNFVFVRGFYKTAFAYGKLFILYTVLALVIIGLFEGFHCVPALEWMNTCGFDHFGSQLIVLAVGVVLFVGGTAKALKDSIKRFELIDLSF